MLQSLVSRRDILLRPPLYPLPVACIITSEVIPEVGILLVCQIREGIQVTQLVTLSLLATIIGCRRCFQSRLSLVGITANQQEPKDDKENVEENVETEMRCKPFLITRRIRLLEDLGNVSKYLKNA